MQIAPQYDKPKMWPCVFAVPLPVADADKREMRPYLLELLDGTGVDTAALVDQVCILM